MFSRLGLSTLNSMKYAKYCQPCIIPSHSISLGPNPMFYSIKGLPKSSKKNLIDDNELDKNMSIFTIEDKVTQSSGLANFIRKTYTATGLGIFGTIGVAQMLDYSNIASQYPVHCLGFGFVASIASIVGINYANYTINETENGLESKNSLGRQFAFGGLVTGMGLTLSPMVDLCNTIDPTILPISMLLSGTVMGGASAYAYNASADKYLSLKAPMMGALCGLVGISFTSLGSGLIFGFDAPLSLLLHNVDIYGGLVVFTGLVVYDTQKSIAMYEDGDPDHLGCATALYLDFVNLLIRMLEIIAKHNQSRYQL